MDRVAAFMSQKSVRRFLALVAFLGVIYLFRHLAILLVFFVTFERSLGWAAKALSARTGLSRKKCVLIVVGVILGALGIAIFLGVGKTIRTFTEAQATMPADLARLKEHPLIIRAHEQVGGTEKLVETAKHYSTNALDAAKAVVQFVIHMVMGFVLAFVFVLEEEELKAFWTRLDRRSFTGIIARWFRHVADATVVTVQLQLIVAACNTVMTLPVLLILGVPNVGALMLLIFVSALVPVIGNIVSGTVLCLLAYQQKGWLGVGIFVGLTFILHKIESYYLSPRLTARHVKIPGFLLIVSLIACEHLFGFKGFFLSFPILFITGRIRSEWLEEDVGASDSPIDLSDSPDQLPGRAGAMKEEPTGMELEHARIPLDSVRPDPPSVPPPPRLPAILKRNSSRPPPPKAPDSKPKEKAAEETADTREE
jgi:predicted PurR-regulated permease PerM